LKATGQDQTEQILEPWARRLDGWGLASPAILVLEALKPFSFIAGQGLLLAEPLLGPRLGEMAALLGDRANLERFITRLETGSSGEAV
jgi:hypothetical protein